MGKSAVANNVHNKNRTNFLNQSTTTAPAKTTTIGTGIGSGKANDDADFKEWPRVPYINKFEYGSNPLNNVAAAIDNGVINLGNFGVDLANSFLLTGETIHNDGFGGYVKALGDEFVQTGKNISDYASGVYKYHTTTPASIQLSDFASELTNPQTLENATTLAVSFALPNFMVV